MKNSQILWFVIGTVFGMGVILAAIAFVPASGPKAAPPTPAAAELEREQLRLCQNLNRSIDRFCQESPVLPSTQAKEATLSSDLQTVRSEIDLYKVQHGDVMPGFDSKGKFDGQRFVAQMTGKTNVDGHIWSYNGNPADYPFGPYLQNFPNNAFIEGRAATFVTYSDSDAPGDASSGWHVNTRTGRLSANDSRQHAAF